jgi:hypothetical protein
MYIYGLILVLVHSESFSMTGFQIKFIPMLTNLLPGGGGGMTRQTTRVTRQQVK